MTVSTIENIEKIMICSLHCKKTDADVTLPGLSEVFSKQKNAAILGANFAKKDGDRFSYWACEPGEIFEFKKDEYRPFEKLRKILAKYQFHVNQEFDLPKEAFKGGWIGYFSYELGRYIEKLPQTTIDDIGMAIIRLCFYDRFICYDHVEGKLWLVALEMPQDIESPLEKLHKLELLVDMAGKINGRR